MFPSQRAKRRMTGKRSSGIFKVRSVPDALLSCCGDNCLTMRLARLLLLVGEAMLAVICSSSMPWKNLL